SSKSAAGIHFPGPVSWGSAPRCALPQNAQRRGLQVGRDSSVSGPWIFPGSVLWDAVRFFQIPLSSRDFLTTTTSEGYDRRPVDITPLEQRKLTFDTHALVQDLETHGFDKTQAETIVSALTTLSNVSLDTIYKEMVTQAQQEITVQQLMAHLDSIRKDMVILEKSEFANLRAENEKMKIELDQVKQQLMVNEFFFQLLISE
uniref:Coiled-coil domain-containing protein 90B, mitochondrial n=1 Tax=Castor canadensis TaxID=51338 RepID=A0A8C0ZQQ8_CASCN